MFYLDDLNRRLVVELQKDAYETHAELARRLGTSKTTVTRRIQRLLGEGVIRIVAVPDPRKLGLNVSALIGLSVDLKAIDAICDQLSAKPQVQMVAVIAGRYDIIISVALASTEELANFVTHELATIDGVRDSETLMAMEVRKQTPGVML